MTVMVAVYSDISNFKWYLANADGWLWRVDWFECTLYPIIYKECVTTWKEAGVVLPTTVSF